MSQPRLSGAPGLSTASRGPPTPGVPSSWTLMQANLPPLCPHSAFYAGISLAGLLTVGAVLGAAATMREAGGLMAGVSSPSLPPTLGWDQERAGR